jgi:hypothetical protein
VTNQNLNETKVVLQSNNFKIIRRAEGFASATLILGVGGLNKKGLVASARKDMYDNAKLEGSQIIICEQTEFKVSNYIIAEQATVAVSGYVVEFTK